MPLVVSSSSTAESWSLDWESPAPVHSWHDLKKNKYKIALRNRQAMALRIINGKSSKTLVMKMWQGRADIELQICIHGILFSLLRLTLVKVITNFWPNV